MAAATALDLGKAPRRVKAAEKDSESERGIFVRICEWNDDAGSWVHGHLGWRNRLAEIDPALRTTERSIAFRQSAVERVEGSATGSDAGNLPAPVAASRRVLARGDAVWRPVKHATKLRDFSVSRPKNGTGLPVDDQSVERIVRASPVMSAGMLFPKMIESPQYKIAAAQTFGAGKKWPSARNDRTDAGRRMRLHFRKTVVFLLVPLIKQCSISQAPK